MSASSSSTDPAPRAIVLSAGRGERMRPLTLATPKPLLAVGGQPLIAWHLQRLAAAGVREVAINTSWLGAQFPAALGDGARFRLALHYFDEGPQPLDTGGGLLNALDWLSHAGQRSFLAINGDIWCDAALAPFLAPPRALARLLLVDNPPQHPAGDFHLGADGRVQAEASPRLTFAGIGSYCAALFDDWRTIIGDTPGTRATPPRFPLAPLLRAAMARGDVDGVHHRGDWRDIGTPERLEALRGDVAGRG
jgi:MurNAc alpha-1-phosphate uridylyltransferase